MSEVIPLVAASGLESSRSIPAHVPAIRTDALYVMFTSVGETLAATRVAAELGKGLGIPITFVHLRPVPYPLSVDRPTGLSPLETEAFLDRVRAERIDARVRVYLCRADRIVIPSAFEPHSLIVVGGRRGLWPTASERLRRRLEAAGHFVLFVECHEEGSHA